MTRAIQLLAVARLVCLAIALSAVVGCKASTHPLDNSNTNWLRMCSTDDDCNGVARCICGMCTTESLDENDCDEHVPQPSLPEPDRAGQKPGTTGAGATKDTLATDPQDTSDTSNVDETAQPTGGETQTPVAGGPGPEIIDRLAPRIPELTGECPDFTSGTIAYQGLEGITIDAGAKGTGDGALLFYWHGTGSTAAEYQFMMSSAALDEIRAQGGIIVSFSGSLGTGGDCSGTGIFSIDDFTIADQITACAVRNYNIDPHRIYTSGCSAGGLQAGCMAVKRSSYIAAALTNSGGLIAPQDFEDANHVPPVMTMHGADNDVVAVSFTMTSTILDQQITQAGGFALDCNHGGSHCGAPIELQQAGWEFLKAHPFGTDTDPYIDGLPSGFPETCRTF